MNWKITRPNRWITFNKGEPYCSFFPVERGKLDDFEPCIMDVSEDQELSETYSVWEKNREKFILGLKNNDEEIIQQGWEKSYFRGEMPDGKKGVCDHQSKLRLKGFQSKG